MHCLTFISSNCLYSNKWKRKWINCKILYPSGKIKASVNRRKRFCKVIFDISNHILAVLPLTGTRSGGARCKGRAKEGRLKSARWLFNENLFFYGSMFVHSPEQPFFLSSLNHKLVVVASKMCGAFLKWNAHRYAFRPFNCCFFVRSSMLLR